MSTSPLDLLPPDRRDLLSAAIAALRDVPNVAALVLGGSYARGLAHSGSDLDIGIYYHESAPLSIPHLRAAAQSLAASGSTPLVTELYGWGPWVNGGAWIQTPTTKIDFVYRNLDQLRRVLDEGRLHGTWRHDFDQQPPFGFRSIVYFAETHYCVPVHDPGSLLAPLKALITPYPAPLKATILQDTLWGAEFSLWSAGAFAASADVCHAAACFTRTAHYLIQALFALNEEYFLNDKHAHRILAQLPLVPRDFSSRLAAILARPGHDSAALQQSRSALRHLWTECVQLTSGAYQPRFTMPSPTPAS